MMALTLFLFAGMCFLSGCFSALLAKTVFHQIVGGMSLVMASVLVAGGAIVNSVDGLSQKLSKTDVPK